MFAPSASFPSPPLTDLCRTARNLETYESVVEEAFDKEERKFFGALDNELERIVAFYETRESDMTKRYEMLARQLQEVSSAFVSLPHSLCSCVQYHS